MTELILVVDDEYHFRNSLKRILQLGGYNVDTAASGKETFAAAKENDYAIVFLDLHLPDIHGLDIAEFLTQNYPDTAIIILTGQASINSAVQAVRFGCFDYLTKPCQPDQVFQVVKRVFETRALKEKLLSSVTKYQRLAEATWESIALFSDDIILEVNKQFCELFNVKEEDVTNHSLHDFIPELDLPQFAELIQENSQKQGIEIEAIRRDGTIFPAEMRLKRFKENNKNLWVAAIRDLTQRREEELQKAKLEEKLNYAMRMESIGLMAGSVAHDLNNILSSIVTFPELLLLNMPANAKYRQEFNRIKQAGEQAAAVVADLLTITRGSSYRNQIHNINDILKDFTRSLDYHTHVDSAPGISFQMILDPLLDNCQISPIHVTKSIINLIKNGIEAINSEGEIIITTKNCTLTETSKGYEAIPPGNYVVLSISDNGQGIGEDHLPHIFEPFYSKKQLGDSGTGLGLTVIIHTIRDHNGFINVESSESGTLFELYFPTANHSKIAPDSLPPIDSLLGRGQKVLVVDDQEPSRLITSAFLKRLGYVPYSAQNGVEAIQVFKQESIDLLLIDMIMDPGLSGYQTYKEILEICPGQKAVVASGYHNHPDREKIRALGVTHYLAKPLSLTHLAMAIKQEMNN